MSDQLLPPMSRRALLGSAIAGGLLLAGCGGSSTTPGSSSAAAGGRPRRGGRFRFSPSNFAACLVADPQSSAAVTFSLVTAFTDGLVYRDHEWKIVKGLAEEFEPNKDFTVWTVRLKPEVEFHDGKTIDADDVIFTIERNLDPKAPGSTSGLMAMLDVDGIKKRDARTVEIPLTYPNSQLLDAFAEIQSALLPVGFDPAKPIGTGPFKQQSFAPGQQWVGTRNENYWQQGKPYLDSLVLVGFTDPNTARSNGLLSGQLDGIDHVLPTQISQLESRGDMQVIVSETGAFEQVEINVAKGYPLADQRAREAFQLMVDREQMVETVYSGLGAVGNDTGGWHQFDPSYPADLPQREQDLDKAKSLLKQAGQEGATVTIRCAELVPGQIPAAELLAQYGGEVGLDVKLDKVTDVAQWYASSAYYTSQVKIDYDYTQSVSLNMLACWAKEAPFNNMGFENPRLESIFRQALATSGARYDELAGEMVRIIHDEGPWLVWGRRNIPDAYTAEFTGASPDASGVGFNGYRWQEIGLS